MKQLFLVAVFLASLSSVVFADCYAEYETRVDYCYDQYFLGYTDFTEVMSCLDNAERLYNICISQ